MSRFNGKRALVTGASAGLGTDFAHLLAGRGCHLVLVARREDRLQQLKTEILAAHPQLHVEVIAKDLGVASAPQELFDECQAKQWPIDVVVNNAGFGVHGAFVASDLDKLDAVLEVNIGALTRLTWLFGREMARRGQGWILQVASNAAFQPVPTYAVYAATKAYVLNFSEAVNFELRKQGVVVTTLCPGVTATEFFQVSGQKLTAFHRLSMMKSRPVCELGLRALERGRVLVEAGWSNWLTTMLATRFLPRWLVRYLAYVFMRNEKL